MMTAKKMGAQPVINVPIAEELVSSHTTCIFRGIVTKKPDNGDTVYNEGYGYIEQDTCCKHWYETKHGRDWFEIDVILVVELS
jgi:hypothetical protein